MSITARTKIAVAVGFLGLAGLIGGTAAVATAAPGPQHDSVVAMNNYVQPGVQPQGSLPGVKPTG